MCSPFGIKVIGDMTVPVLMAVPVLIGIVYIIIYIYNVSDKCIYNAYKNKSISDCNCILGLTKKILISSIFAFKTK